MQPLSLSLSLSLSLLNFWVGKRQALYLQLLENTAIVEVENPVCHQWMVGRFVKFLGDFPHLYILPMKLQLSNL